MTKRGNYEGSVYWHKAAGCWAAAASLGYDENGRRIRKTVYGGTKNEVVNRLSEIKAQIAKEKKLQLEPSKDTVSDFAERWLEDSVKPRIKEGSYLSYKDVVDFYIRPYFGNALIKNLGPLDVIAGLKRMENDGLSSGVRRRTFVHLKMLFDCAVAWRVIERAPTDGVDRPRHKQKKGTTLNEEQLRKLFQVAEKYRIYPVIVLLSTTGMRFGEVAGLLWEDVDLRNGVIQIKRQLCRRTKKLIPPKTPAALRTLRLTPKTLEALRRRRAQALAEGGISNPFVFTTRLHVPSGKGGNPLTPSDFHGRFKRILAEAGLPSIRPHDLRHSCATVLLNHGMDIGDLSRQLGHTNPVTTMGIYVHGTDKHSQSAADKMTEALG